MIDWTPYVDAAVDAAELDYVDMDRLRTVVCSDLPLTDKRARWERTAEVLALLTQDDRVVVVEAEDMLTPVNGAEIKSAFLKRLEAEGHVGTGDLAWVMDRATWERDVARKSAGTTADE